jgi:CubicO group peptidase (beta-lactamase class C family)
MPDAETRCVDGGAPLLAELQRVHDEQRNVGLAVGVLRGGEVAFRQDLGLADLEHEVPVSASTRFGIASVTKAFTGALVLRLVEQGRLDLDAPVAVYVDLDEGRDDIRGADDLRAPWLGAITVRHLLTHLSGLPHPNERTPELFATHYESATSALDAFVDVAPVSEPGEAYRYSSTNYNLLAAIVESVTARTFDVAMSEQILTPLGLTDTGVDDVLAVLPGRARRYSFYQPWTYAESDTLYRVPSWDYSFNPGGGNMYSSLDDLLAFGGALPAPGFFSPEAWEALYEPLAEGSRWSYGWFYYPAESGEPDEPDEPTGPRLSISGANPGLQAALGVFPEHEVVVAVLSNAWGKNSRSADLIDVTKFARLCLGMEP